MGSNDFLGQKDLIVVCSEKSKSIGQVLAEIEQVK